MLANRKDFGIFLNTLGLLGEGVELGVNSGEFSRIILNHWQGSKLHLIDAWEKQDNLVYNDLCNHASQDHYTYCYQQTHNKFHNNPRVKIHKKYSEEAVKMFQDESLDFVYLDANHSFTETYKDIENWSKKVKQGGLISGHDFVNGYIHNSVWFGSKYAVVKWAEENKYQIYTSWEDNDFPSWFIFKDKVNLSDKKILILSGHTGSSDLIDKLQKNHKAYADAIGCDYIFETENYCLDRQHQWNKIKWILKHQKNYDWIIWVDADVVFMHDRNPLTTHINNRFDFIGCIYHTNIYNSGILLIQSTDESKDMLDLAWESAAETKYSYPHEEKTLTEVFQPFVRKNSFGCGMDIFNNHPGLWYKEYAPHYHVTGYHKNRDAIMYDLLNMSQFKINGKL
jgi:hypothetical protein